VTGREQNEMARDAYSYLHYPMVAGVVAVALGLKTTLAHVDEPLATVPAVALAGGTSLYLLGHVAFRFRTLGMFHTERLVLALAVLCVVPLARELDALASVAVVTGLLGALIVYETLRYSDDRARVRSELLHGHHER
jgi:low temperature requirement protein LtrA